MQTVERMVKIDGQPVTIEVRRLPLGAYEAACHLAYPRGTTPDADQVDAILAARIQAVNDYVRALPDQVIVDGHSVQDQLGVLFGARADVINHLFDVVLAAQQLTPEEQRDLEIAVRFSHWLALAMKRESTSEWVQTQTNCEACRARGLCAKRGCDGTRTRKPVWHDGRLVVKTCPVRSFTPEIERVMRLFFWTHDAVADGGWVRWQMTRLPEAGSVAEQDAWTYAALAAMRAIQMDLAKDQAHG